MREMDEVWTAIAAARATSDPDEKLRRTEDALGRLERVAGALSPTMSWQAKRVLSYLAKEKVNPGSGPVSSSYIAAIAEGDGISASDVHKGFADLVEKGCLIDVGGGQYELTDAGCEHIA